jgi:hypothetical protein
VDQMTQDTGQPDSRGIEERLLDQVADTIGGVGSLSIISGGSADQRHETASRLLEEAEGMGCVTLMCDCTHSISGSERLFTALSDLWRSLGGNVEETSSDSTNGIWPSDRSYRREMKVLELLRTMTSENSVVIVMEEMGAADQATMCLVSFLARNLGGMSAMIIANHSLPAEDQNFLEMIEELKHDIPVHELHIHEVEGVWHGKAIPARNDVPSEIGVDETDGRFATMTLQIKGLLISSQTALAAGNVISSVHDAQDALKDSISIGHQGLQLDSYVALGVALTQAGKEKESLHALDMAINLAITLGEPLSQRLARLRKSELLLFSTGEPDSALSEAVSANRPGSRKMDETSMIEPLALSAVIEARNGRRDRAEKAFCDASGMLERRPTDELVLERMLLALAAALLLESRHDLAGMNARYAEAEVLASGTDSPVFWSAMMIQQHGLSLLRLKRPREARSLLDRSALQFDRLGNAVQSARVKRTVQESDAGPLLD